MPGKSAQHFLKRLRELQEEEPMITAARGRGLFLAFDLPIAKTREEFWKGLFDLRRPHAAVRRKRHSIPTRRWTLPTEVVDEAIALIREQCRRMTKVAQFPACAHQAASSKLARHYAICFRKIWA